VCGIRGHSSGFLPWPVKVNRWQLKLNFLGQVALGFLMVVLVYTRQ